MDRDTYSVPEVRKYLGQAFVPVRLNAESSKKVAYNGGEYSYRELASGFKVNGYPTTLFLEADGKHIISAPGYMKAPDFLAVLRYIGDGHYKNMDFQQYRADQDRASTSKTAE
jgi:thioredoxin-related protein